MVDFVGWVERSETHQKNTLREAWGNLTIKQRTVTQTQGQKTAIPQPISDIYPCWAVHQIEPGIALPIGYGFNQVRIKDGFRCALPILRDK